MHIKYRVLASVAMLAACSAEISWAQQPAAPATPAAAPREELEPAVNTSAPLNAPAAPKSATAPAAAHSPESPAPAAGGAGTTTPKAAAPKAATKSGKAMDRIQLDTTQITGNRELPKVLYIVPWKRSDLGDLVGKPVNSLLDEVLQPVDRDVFNRENRYYRALAPGQNAPAAPGAAGTPNGGSGPAPGARDER